MRQVFASQPLRSLEPPLAPHNRYQHRGNTLCTRFAADATSPKHNAVTSHQHVITSHALALADTVKEYISPACRALTCAHGVVGTRTASVANRRTASRSPGDWTSPGITGRHSVPPSLDSTTSPDSAATDAVQRGTAAFSSTGCSSACRRRPPRGRR
jgi:hypothetical protein